MEIENNVSNYKNVARLLEKADTLGYSLDDAFIGYNSIYGNTYLFSYSESFTLYISDFDSRIKALYTCFYDGEETSRLAGNNKKKLDNWVQKLLKKSEKKEQAR